MKFAQLLRGRRARRGTVAILVALLLTGLLGVLALALDGGVLQDDRRRLQAAADAAALSAATELFNHYPAIAAGNFTTLDPGGTAAAAAQSSCTNSGYPNDGSTATVVVNIPPTSGPFKDLAGFAEVIITYYQPRFFSAIWGSDKIAVSARAVARGRWAGTGDGIILLDPSVKDSLDASGTGSVSVTGGAAVIVNSNNSEAARGTGGGGVTANDFEITGGYTGALHGTIHTGTTPIPDPLRYLPVPSVPPNGTMTTTNLTQGNKRYVLSPGRYNSLPNFNAGDEVVFQQASANSNGGIFYIDGGGLKSTGANISMDSTTSGGMMIYNNPSNSSSNQQIQISGNSSGSVQLSPLTSGPYAGMLLFQNRTSTVPLSISGNGTFSLQGTFYAANAQLGITGNGNATIGSQYISRTLTLSGNGNITINYTDNGTARLREVLLEE